MRDGGKERYPAMLTAFSGGSSTTNELWLKETSATKGYSSMRGIRSEATESSIFCVMKASFRSFSLEGQKVNFGLPRHRLCPRRSRRIAIGTAISSSSLGSISSKPTKVFKKVFSYADSERGGGVYTPHIRVRRRVQTGAHHDDESAPRTCRNR